MPELPEAETIVRGLRSRVSGAIIHSVSVVHSDVLRVDAHEFIQSLTGDEIGGVTRRGKNVVFELESGRRMVVNLGMTGRLLPYGNVRPQQSSHPAVDFTFREGAGLVFDDVRRFGAIELLTAAEWRRRNRALGPEPLAPRYSARHLAAALSRSKSPIRSWLLDQRRIAGVGNIYASESLWMARIHPRRPACELKADEVRRLHRSIRSVLRNAIAAGGTTLRDYRNADGDVGEFARRLEAYGREERPCRRCGTPIERIVISNRAAFFCPRCQPCPA